MTMTTTTSINVLIIDDETPAREELIWLLEQCDVSTHVLGQADSAKSALSALNTFGKQVDLVFMDIDMPGVNGVRFAESLQDHTQGSAPLVIFVTAYQEYALEAFNVDAVDYLLKPVRIKRLGRALEKAKQMLQTPAASQSLTPPDAARTLERISVEERGVYRVIPIEDILFFSAEDGIVMVQTRTSRHMTDFSLKFLEQNLDLTRFFRCHRSTIVNLDAIDSIAPWGAGTYRLVVDRAQDLGVPLARSKAGELKALIPWSASVFEGSQ